MSVAAGNLIQDFSKYDTVCLPVGKSVKLTEPTTGDMSVGFHKCFYMRLYTPQGYSPNYSPFIQFLTVSSTCPFYLGDNLTIAKICMNITSLPSQGSALVDVEFYEDIDYNTGVGMYSLSSTDLSSNIIQNAVSVGHCPMQVKSTILTESDPISAPTSGPPKNMTFSLFTNSSYPSKCYSSCSSYPGKFNNITAKDTCNFLLESIYIECSSYDISNGYCKQSICSKECPLTTYCYYGVLSISYCDTIIDTKYTDMWKFIPQYQDNKHSANSLSFVTLDTIDSKITNQINSCIKSYEALYSSTSTDSNKSSSNMNPYSSLYIIAG